MLVHVRTCYYSLVQIISGYVSLVQVWSC